MSMDYTSILNEVYAAINRDHIPAALQYFELDAVRIEPEGFPLSGTYQGHAELLTHFTAARSTWAEGKCEPERFEVHGEKVIVHLHVRVRLKDAEKWIDARVSDGFIFRDGKIIEFRTFADSEAAQSWAREG